MDIEIDFMRKSRFLKIKDKFDSISKIAQEVIDSAGDTDIIYLSLVINSVGCVTVIKANICTEDMFIQLAF